MKIPFIKYNKVMLTKKSNKDKFDEYMKEIKKICPTYPVCSNEDYNKVCIKSVSLFNDLMGIL